MGKDFKKLVGSFKDLVDKMSDESKAKVKKNLKKEVKKMEKGTKKAKKSKKAKAPEKDEYLLKTTRYETDKYVFVLTQEFFWGNGSGQYNWALFNGGGDLVRTGGMDGNEEGGLEPLEIRDLGDKEILRYATWLDLLVK